MTASSLNGKTVVVIGGGSGIGFAIAQGALAEGAEVVIGSSQQARIDGAVAQLGDGARGASVDVTDEVAVAAFLEEVGAFHHLAFTAGDWGAMAGSPITELEVDNAGAVFNVRFWGAVKVVKHAARTIAKDGSITLTDGTIAHRPRKGSAISTAMAGAVEHLTRGLAVDLAPIRVNAVCPAGIATGVWDSIPADQRAERFRRMTERQPLPRIGKPEEAAEAYLYLMKAGYTTGQVLKVDGGSLIV
jgi:NAD(P)-dependent dehydrogenase (short-subunit alcohol dehydrogenase family)